MSIKNLISDVASRGISRPNRFEVVIRPPSSVFGDTTSLTLSCEIATLPGKGYSTNERRTYGPLTKMPYEKLFNEIQMAFRCDGSMSEKKFFDDWYNAVAVPLRHHFNYYNDYIGTINIKQLDGREKTIYTATLLEAYPVNIGDMELNQEPGNSYHRLPVTFVYKEWIST